MNTQPSFPGAATGRNHAASSDNSPTWTPTGSGGLAPCFDAAEEDDRAVECPICFHFYPSLNRSKCCGKGICTECFVQLMPSKASRSVHCPFCKTTAYAVKYRGARTLSEKKLQREKEPDVHERRWTYSTTIKVASPVLQC